ncbi:MAG: hypothetical protein QOH13_2004, partial [Thermoleophilaceae bacterium]|nr:hypothetical protein [Thermoleophilaceae bacterium]
MPNKVRYMQQYFNARQLTNVTSLLLCGLLAGIVVAAAAFPLVGSVGLTAKAASDSFEDLPSDLKAGPPPLTSNLYAANGARITSFYDENRVTVPITQMSATMQNAIVAAEDIRFYTHKGTDPQGIMRAAFVNFVSNGGTQQGGSTLTQQYVKQALYYSAKTDAERTAAIAPNGGRKLQEMRYAISLEQKLTKKQILERYLNIANFGNRSYGVAAAAQGYFSKPATQLSLSEAALLASIVKNPEKFNPIDGDKAAAKQRRNYVINSMLTQKMITQKQADDAKKTQIVLKPKKSPRLCENGDPKYGFYCSWFVEWWKSNPKFGNTRKEREDNLFKGGYNIYTALDPDIQAAAQAAADNALDSGSRFADGVVVVEPGSGRVKAMATSRPYGLKAPATTAPLLGGSTAIPGYQAGSTFKMFTMVAALEQGSPLNTHIQSDYQYISHQFTGGSCGDQGFFCPHNADQRMSGDHTMWSAFGESVNTYFVQLEERVGVKAAIQAAEQLGLRLTTSTDKEQKAAALKSPSAWGSFTLGVANTTPLMMANAYATLAARGKYCDPLPLQRITDASGKPLPFANPTCKQTVPREVADAANDAARCPVGDQAHGSCTHPGGGVTVASVGRAFDREIAGKSGTTDSGTMEPSAWFVGYTPNLAAASFVANPNKIDDDVSGVHNVPQKIFNKTMGVALDKYKAQDFVPPTDAMMYGVEVSVPDVDGQSLSSAER